LINVYLDNNKNNKNKNNNKAKTKPLDRSTSSRVNVVFINSRTEAGKKCTNSCISNSNVKKLQFCTITLYQRAAIMCNFFWYNAYTMIIIVYG
jgi:hypothetical protein